MSGSIEIDPEGFHSLRFYLVIYHGFALARDRGELLRYITAIGCAAWGSCVGCIGVVASLFGWIYMVLPSGDPVAPYAVMSIGMFGMILIIVGVNALMNRVSDSIVEPWIWLVESGCSGAVMTRSLMIECAYFACIAASVGLCMLTMMFFCICILT